MTEHKNYDTSPRTWKGGSSILDIPLSVHTEGYSNGKTIRDFFAACLLKLWEEEEGFGGKRPFGGSGWVNDIVFAVAKHRGLSGDGDEPLEDEDGYFNSIDEKEEEKILHEITAALQEWLGVNA